MDPSTALITGLLTGFAIAMQIGAISLLLIETAVAGGTAAAVAAGLGVATVDLAFGGVAAATGGAAGAALTRHEDAIRIVAAVVLAAIAIWGVIGVLRRRGASDAAVDAAPARGHYARFVAMTAANPLTIASFAAVAAATAPGGALAALAFVAGIGAGSAIWHLVLALGAGQARRWITGRARDALALGGRVVVLGIAAHLALGAV